MVRSRTSSQGGGSQGFEMERKYSVPSNPESRTLSGTASEDLHAWSIYRQNLNSDFTDSALGSTDKSPLPYGNFQLRDTTVQSILSHPRYGPKSALGSNMYTYLKFGLPRVFPPNQNGSNRSTTPQQFQRGMSSRPRARGPKTGSRGPRDGSSGYDSSDNETSNQYKNNRKYRSDPDFRMQNVHASYHVHGPNPGVPLAALQQGEIRHSQWNRNKSISEANLLNNDYTKTYNSNISQHLLRDPRRNSVADVGHHNDIFDHSHIIRPMSKAESHLSMAQSRRGPSVIRNEYMSHDDDLGLTYVYPHLQVHGLGILPNAKSKLSLRSKQHLLVNDVSFEVRGGEVLAVMATSEEEGTAILDVIAGHSKPIIGDLLLNGQNVRKNMLRSRVSYVQSDTHLCKDLTAMQTLQFHYDLKKPTRKLEHLKIDAIERINVLIEDLGLEQVRNSKVEAMTMSERRRLNVACHLLLDTDLVILDQPTKGMDIFDTFFLVEYLRQWASGGSGNTLGRIVIITLHPPTYEIFTMLSRILLISAGRTMFSGRRRDMLPYFTLVDYPCPSFKNPSDYYLDLVTLDDLSAEAMLESSQRIEQLAELFRQKQQPMSDPGPPATLPMTIKHSNFFLQCFVLFTKAMFYTQPNTFVKWLSIIIMSISMSLIMGAIFWDIPNSDPQLNLNDRISYHYSTMCIACWPILLALTIMEVRSNYKTVESDINDRLYTRASYILTKTFINLPPSLFVWLVYLVPSYSMSGLYMQSTTNYAGFYIYIGYMVLYLSCIQMLVLALFYLFPFSTFSAVLSGIFITAMSFSSGYVIHFKDIAFYTKWLDYVNPQIWLLPDLLGREYSQEAIASSSAKTLCRNKQVQHQEIIMQLPCPPPNGSQILSNFGYLHSKEYFNYGNVPISLIVFNGVCIVVLCFAFIINCCGQKYRGKRNNNANKP